MDKELLIAHMEHLLTKYLNDRMDLTELIRKDSDSVKCILSEIDQGKQIEYEETDLELIRDISFYYL